MPTTPQPSVDLYERYPWLRIPPAGPEYLEPTYYNALLKEYRFAGKKDLDIFDSVIHGLSPEVCGHSLEIGPGTFRATNIFLGRHRPLRLLLVDLSKRMLEFSMMSVPPNASLTYVNSDAVEFLLRTDSRFGFVYSLWGMSHSIHQTLIAHGLVEGLKIAKRALVRLFTDSLDVGGRFFIIHFDSTSPEQTILFRQRQKMYPFFRPGVDSPSIQTIREVLEGLREEARVEFSCDKLAGDPILYRNVDEALEIFMNLHLESAFNLRADVGAIVDELRRDLLGHQTHDGAISVHPGCYRVCARRLR